jgi:long-chain acyl-CoA synthetase
MPYASLPALFFERARQLAGQRRYIRHAGGTWGEVDWTAMENRVLEVAAALLELDLAPGERVAILGMTSPEWLEVDMAILACGAVTVPLYPNCTAAECRYILEDSEAVAAFAGTPELRARVDRPGLRAVVTIAAAERPEESLEAFRARGRQALPGRRAEILARSAALQPSDLASLAYTSGTTGTPKGVLHTHRNHLASIAAVEPIGLIGKDEVNFLFLPLAHGFGRLVAQLDMSVGAVTAFARGPDTIAEDLRATRPHVLPAVPRLLEKLHARILAGRAAAAPRKQRLFDWALDVGRRRARLREEGRPVPLGLRLRDALAHRLVFARIHRLLGGRVRYIISGAAPLSPEVAAFFHALRLPVLEGYGLTETTPSLTVNRPDRFRLGTVGLPLDCCTIRLAADGEILARGDNIAIGYHRQPQATAETFDAEGWLHTGDVGEVDADGFLRITDRKKDLIKTSIGKYVAPQHVENLLKLQPHISQAAVIGDGRPYCVALLTLDAEAMAAWARGQGLPSMEPATLAQDPAVRTLIGEEVAAANRELARHERVNRFFILPRELSIEGGELTPTLKVKRRVLAERHQREIAELYR